MLKPYLVQEVRQFGHPVRDFGPVVLKPQICSGNTLRLLKQCLVGVVTEGTAKSLNTPLYQIAGKTGTALVANGTNGYKDHIYQSSFAGYFPADHPVYTCIVVIRNKPHAENYLGAKVAGPVFRDVSDQLYALYTKGSDRNLVMDSTMVSFAGNASVWSGLGIKVPDTGWVTGVTGPAQGFRWTFEKTPATEGVPSVQGMGLKDALYLLENKGLKVNARGRGKVLAQSLPAGAAIRKGDIIYLQLG
jgi:cell division protein FtsI (penicillin-binding protein 3)